MSLSSKTEEDLKLIYIKKNQCKSCSSYAGNGLIQHKNYFHCAIYPSGPDTDNCPDFVLKENQMENRKNKNFIGKLDDWFTNTLIKVFFEGKY